MAFSKYIFSILLLMTTAAFAATETTVENEGIDAFYNGQYEQAETVFLTKLDDPDLNVEALMYLSRIALATGDFDKATERIEQAMKASPDSTQAVILSADIYCRHAQNLPTFRALRAARRCISQYESAIERDNDNIRALMSAARYHLHAPTVAGGSSRKARELISQLTRISPEHGLAIKIAWHEIIEGDREAAIKLADQLSEEGIQFAQNQYDIAMYYRNVKAYDKALALFEDLSSHERTHQNQWIINDSLLQAGEIHIEIGENIARGIELIEAYKRANNNPYDVHYFWSTWSLAKGYKAIGEHDKYRALVDDILAQEYSRDREFSKVFEADIKQR